MSGRRRASSCSGVSSSKTATRSTQSSAASTSARSAAVFSGRPGPFSRRTESSEFMQTTRQSPSDLAACSMLTCPACSTSKQPPAATTTPPLARTASTVSCGLAGAGAGSASDATPPSARYRVAAATAHVTASDSVAPSRSAADVATANWSPAPHGSVTCSAVAGTASGACPERASRAPRLPSVTAAACTGQLPSSRSAAAAAPITPRAPSPAARAASAALGVTTWVPGTGSLPRGCGSHTSRIRAARRVSASRSTGSAVVPWP
jgi:hypothetical protein